MLAAMRVATHHYRVRQRREESARLRHGLALQRGELRLPGRSAQVRTEALAEFLRLLQQLARLKLAAIEAAVNSGINIAPDNTASRDQQHAIERDAGVQRFDLEIGMQDHQRRPDDAEDHVQAKPARDAAPRPHPFYPFAQWIEQQNQHQRAADDAEGIAQPVLGIDQVVVAVAPTQVERRDDQNDENNNAGGVFASAAAPPPPFLALAAHDFPCGDDCIPRLTSLITLSSTGAQDFSADDDSPFRRRSVEKPQ